MRKMRFGLDEKPGTGPMLLYGLQWWAISLPSAILMGAIVARMHFAADPAMQTAYVQKLFGLMGVVTVIQVLWGHRLPLVVGPSTVLLAGISASASSDTEALYTAMLVGGAFLALFAFSGLLSRARLLFTPRVVAVILVLIALTLAPAILALISGNAARAASDLSFAIALVFGLFVLNRLLPGVWKSLTVLAGLAGGSLLYFLLAGFPALPGAETTTPGFPLFIRLQFDAGTILSFLFCYLALLINELGSVESIGQMLRAREIESRIRRGAGIQGLANMVAGSVGVIGTVDYSMSAGVISATSCASRYTLVPAGAGLMLCVFFPGAIRLLGCIPPVVMGALMLYLMAAQLASGLSMLVEQKAVTDFSNGSVVALPLMIGLLAAFTPAAAIAGFPEILRPVLGNGFVMGTITVLFLEHLLLREKT